MDLPNRLRIELLLPVVAASLLVCSGCTKHVTANCQPKAPSIAGFDSVETQGLGFLNIVGYPDGEVFELDPDGHGHFFANHIDFLHFNSAAGSTDFTEGNPQDTTVQVAVSWSISGDFSGTSAEAVSIQSQLDNKLTFNLSQGIRAGINNTIVTLNDGFNNGAKTQITAHPNLVYMIINPVELGNKAELALAHNVNVSGNVSLLKVGKVTVDVKYACTSDTLIQQIADGPKATVLVYPEFVQADATGTINHVGGARNSHLLFAVPARNITSPAHRITLVLCSKSGNDLSAYPGCKNQ